MWYTGNIRIILVHSTTAISDAKEFDCNTEYRIIVCFSHINNLIHLTLYVGPTAESEADTRSLSAFGEPKLHYRSVNHVRSEPLLYRITNSRKHINSSTQWLLCGRKKKKPSAWTLSIFALALKTYKTHNTSIRKRHSVEKNVWLIRNQFYIISFKNLHCEMSQISS